MPRLKLKRGAKPLPAMRGVLVRRGLFVPSNGDELPHCQRMGMSLWAFGWLLIHRDVHTGQVMAPLRELASDLGVNRGTASRWLDKLVSEEYLREVSQSLKGHRCFIVENHAS